MKILKIANYAAIISLSIHYSVVVESLNQGQSNSFLIYKRPHINGRTSSTLLNSQRSENETRESLEKENKNVFTAFFKGLQQLFSGSSEQTQNNIFEQIMKPQQTESEKNIDASEEKTVVYPQAPVFIEKPVYRERRVSALVVSQKAGTAVEIAPLCLQAPLFILRPVYRGNRVSALVPSQQPGASEGETPVFQQAPPVFIERPVYREVRVCALVDSQKAGTAVEIAPLCLQAPLFILRPVYRGNRVSALVPSQQQPGASEGKTPVFLQAPVFIERPVYREMRVCALVDSQKASTAVEIAPLCLQAPLFILRPAYRGNRVSALVPSQKASTAVEIAPLCLQAPLFILRPLYRGNRVSALVPLQTTTPTPAQESSTQSRAPANPVAPVRSPAFAYHFNACTCVPKTETPEEKPSMHPQTPLFIQRPVFRERRVSSLLRSQKSSELPAASTTKETAPKDPEFRAKRMAARAEARLSTSAVSLAEKLSLPKLKEFIRVQGGSDRLPAGKSSDKSLYIALAVELASKNSWKEAVELLTTASQSQAKGFAAAPKKMLKKDRL